MLAQISVTGAVVVGESACPPGNGEKTRRLRPRGVGVRDLLYPSVAVPILLFFILSGIAMRTCLLGNPLAPSTWTINSCVRGNQ